MGCNCISLHNTQITGMQSRNSTGSQLAYGVFQPQNKNVDKSELHLQKEERVEGESEGQKVGTLQRKEIGRREGKRERGREMERIEI